MLAISIGEDMETLVTLGRRIREARVKKHITREALAEMLEITPYYLGEIEREVKTPSLALFVRLCEVLDVSSDYLLRDTLPVASEYISSDIARKVERLTPKHRLTIEAIIDAYIKSI